MKKEILRINNLDLHYSNIKKLNHISCVFLAGEITGLLGLTRSGKDLFVKMLYENTSIKYEANKILVNDHSIILAKDISANVYLIHELNYKISSWSIEEYLCLVDSSGISNKKSKKKIEGEIKSFLDSISVNIDIQKKLGQLTEYEKRVIDLFKANKQNKKIIIIEDEFSGFTIQEMIIFRSVLKKVIHEKTTVIVNSHSDLVTSILSDKYIIFKEGSIVKKCNKKNILNKEQLESFLLGIRDINAKKDLDSEKEIYYKDQLSSHPSIKKLSKEDMNKLKFRKGKITSLLVLNNCDKEFVFQSLFSKNNSIFSNDSTKEKNNIYRYRPFENTVAYIKHLGSKDELFSSMSIEENLLLPSLDKISTLEYLKHNRKIKKMLKKSLEKTLKIQQHEIETLDINNIITITLERWYIYNPDIIILFEPFIECDIYGVAIVKSFIKKFSSKGTSVIIIKSRDEYIKDISDNIIQIS